MNNLSGWQRLRSRWLPATKHDLRETEHRLSMKISELKTEIGALTAQVTKIAGEQQAKYDALAAAYAALEAQLADMDLDPDTTTALTNFKAQLQAFDDLIPDVNP